MILANILDPVQDGLDPTVFDHPDTTHPVLKEHHRTWIVNAVTRTLEKAGYTHADQWLGLVLTGSLTTYQYGPDSDVDVSLFVDVEHFPEWSRAEMIGVMVEGLDGKPLPGTTHNMQNFVVPPDIERQDLFQPGLRSGYDLLAKRWIVPPEKGRSQDVEKEMNAAYVYAQECADKMDRLLKFDPDKAVFYWHMLHKARQRDQRAGKGDYSLTNIVYKFLAKKNLLPEIAMISGEYIAKEAWTTLPDRDWTGEQITVADVGDHANDSVVTEVDNLTTYLEDGRILPGDEVVRTGKVAMPVPIDWMNPAMGGILGSVGYHDAPAEHHASILANGLLPWDHANNAGGTRYPGGYLQPRPGHVYLGLDHPGEHGYGASHGPEGHVVYHIDLKRLDPQMINPDEDHMPGEGTFRRDDESYGDVAERTGWGDDPQAAIREIRMGHTLAHRGPIPANAIMGWTHYMPSKWKFHEDEQPMTPNPGYSPESYTASVKTADMTCPHCRGNGVDPEQPGEICPVCQGLGNVSMNKFHTPPQVPIWNMPVPGADSFKPVDPWMDNEPGSLVMPKHWGKTSAHMVDPRAIDKAQYYLGLKHPVKVHQVPKAIVLDGQPHGAQYHGLQNGAHQISVVSWLRPETASDLLWHELAHAQQYERDPAAWHAGQEEYNATRQQGLDAYMNHPDEQEARAAQTPFPLALNHPTQGIHGSIQIKDQWTFEEEAGR